MTIKIYQQDSYQKTFDAKIIGHQQTSHGPGLVLDRTCFYLDAGGQPSDHGHINNIPVVDVVEIDGAHVHVLESAIRDTEDAHGEIDWARRYDHMQQHTGQHVLSGTFFQLYEAQTLSFHLGTDYCTIDLPLKKVTPDMIAIVEAHCQALIRENRRVQPHFVDESELHKFPLRKMPPDVDHIRILEIENFDYTPCGGTHVQSTGELNLIKIIATEKVKQGTRIKFLVGDRAVADYTAKHDLLDAISNDMTCGWPEIPDVLRKLGDERKELRREIDALQQQLARFEAEKLIRQADKVEDVLVISRILLERDMAGLSEIARQIVDNHRAVALLMGEATKVAVVFARSDGIELNMGHLVRTACQHLDGGGGGRPEFAQGAGNNADKAPSVLAEMTQHVKEYLAQK